MLKGSTCRTSCLPRSPITSHSLGSGRSFQLEHSGCVEPIPISDAANDTVIDARWVRKREWPNEVRCHLIAKDYNTGDKRDDTFAATPVSEGKFIIDVFAVKQGWGVVVGDVSVAFLHADAIDEWLYNHLRRPRPRA